MILGGLLLELFIIQQEHVMTELQSYITQNPPPADTPSVRCTLKYLTACNMLFEQGLLSHDRVHVKDVKVIENIKVGYSFFSSWLSNLLLNG